ncbi:MAG TPA: CDP-diacylglycerol--glycerol-3-phosphate 3-phosphatidyltransferase [Thermotogota bacterium]|nr:CDP-diacylglycerol--glycerol-3-phosphate 3-phosphatidyltransferase [Thermotogota bacterium]HRW91426.1 CDP-diacylglycerol--glycerol-3-phosphate 3-phosphatidyltransferase [Thermotogota bacterium]
MKVNLATKITLFRVVIIPVLMWGISLSPMHRGWALFSLVLFVVGSLSDWLDGFVARRFHQVSTLGKFLDQLADKAFVSGVLCALVAIDRVSFWLLAIVLFRDIAVSGVRMLAASKGTVIAANWWGKWKTASQMLFLVVVLLSFLFPGITSTWIAALSWIVAIVTVLSGWSYFQGVKEYFD